MNMEKDNSKNRVFLSLVIGALLVVGYLVTQASNTGISTVLLPSELMALSGDVPKRLRIAGRVAPGTIQYSVEPRFLLEFSIKDPGQDSETVQVVYQGIKPDMFAVGRDVILDGEWTDNVFQASKLMTQCPSKYEPPLPEGAPATRTVE